MSTSQLTAWRHIAIALLAVISLPSSVRADATSLMLQAEKALQRDDLQEAERLYRRALDLNEPGTTATCHDRLLAIYVRGNRHDRAIAIARAMQARQPAGDRASARRVEWQLGSSYFALGHLTEARRHLETALSEGPAPLALPLRLDAVYRLARIAKQTQADPDPYWNELDRLVGRIREPAGADERRRSIEVVRMLADADMARGRRESAAARLSALVAVHQELADWTGLAETLLRRARTRETADPGVESDLLEAKAALDRAPARSTVLLRGDVSAALVDWYRRRKDAAKAANWQAIAVRSYSQLLEDPELGPEGLSATLTAYWRLQSLYRATRQFSAAHQLSQLQERDWGVNHLLESRWKAHHGALSMLVHQYASALPRLREAVDQLERQVPPNLQELPRAWLYLAHIEQIHGDPRRAAELAEKCLRQYREQLLSADHLLVEAHAVQGTMLCLQGKFAQAVDVLQAGLALCEGLPDSGPLECLLLLNRATVHQAQGEIGLALKLCQEAYTKFQETAEPEAPGHATFRAALAGMSLAEGDLAQAGEYADQILRDASDGATQPDDRVTALHCRALLDLSQNQIDLAEARWQEALALQKSAGDLALLPRTYNCLGLVCECRRDSTAAEAWYRKAYELETTAISSFPAVRFITHWRLATALDGRGERAEARRVLADGLGFAESTRRQTFGDLEQRARYFAQFKPGIQQLVDWSLRDGDWDAAVRILARSRSRTLEDRMLVAGADPRAGLDAAAQDLVTRESDLQNRLSAVRLQALLLTPEQQAQGAGARIAEQYQQLQRELSEIQSQIQTQSPLYRGLALAESTDLKLTDVQSRLADRQVLLQYVVGEPQCWLFIIPAKGREPQAFPLTVDTLALKDLPELKPAKGAERIDLKNRGFRIEPQADAADARPLLATGEVVPLQLPALRTLATLYLQRLSNPDEPLMRGMRVEARRLKPMLDRHSAALGNALLPDAVRRLLRDLKSELAVVVPDGPLHKLPLETLMCGSGESARFAIDELPPTIYAPSLGAFVRAQRKEGGLNQLQSLLTLANPAYSEQPFGDGWLKGFPALPGTRSESERIQCQFPEDGVLALHGDMATEANLVAGLSGRQVVHIAAHGFADLKFDNQFGALAITPPPQEASATDDGFLHVDEISRLPLQACELAVLSACDSNVGSDGPLEAGVTLGNAFLVAGARRVVASHWPVADKATAELMDVFFRELATANAGDRKPARALHAARKHMHRKHGHPFYWGAFTLSGQVD